jgi:hypothetical protein
MYFATNPTAVYDYVDSEISDLTDYVDTQDAAVAAAIEKYYSLGDISAADYNHTTLTCNNTWQELDLSSKVPEGTKRVKIRIYAMHSATGNILYWRKHGYSNDMNLERHVILVANLQDDYAFEVEVDNDRHVDYRIPAGFTQVYVFILGYYK